MFGNTQGWLISAAIGLAMAYLLYFVGAPPARTDPTNAASLAITRQVLTLPVPWDTIVSPGSKDGDAADAYQKATAEYTLNVQNYERFEHGGAMTVPESDMPAIGNILEGRDCKNFHMFDKNAAKLVNYDNTEPPIESLSDIGRICCTMGKLYTNANYTKSDPARAVQLWQAVFVLGGHLYDERVSWSELVAGHGLMQMAGGNLVEYYKDQKKQGEADKIQKFLDAEGEYQLKITEAIKIVSGIDESYAGKYAGDIFQIAQSSTADPMFRAEALKHIGHYRYNAMTSGDQLAAKKVLRVMADKSDLPAGVKAAAIAARDMTIQQHNMVGGGT